MKRFLFLTQDSFQPLPYSKFCLDCNAIDLEILRDFMERHGSEGIDYALGTHGLDYQPLTSQQQDSLRRMMTMFLNLVPNLKTLNMSGYDFILTSAITLPSLFPHLRRLSVRLLFCSPLPDGTNVVKEIITRSPTLAEFGIAYEWLLRWHGSYKSLGQHLQEILRILPSSVDVKFGLNGQENADLLGSFIETLTVTGRTIHSLHLQSLAGVTAPAATVLAAWLETQPQIKLEWFALTKTVRDPDARIMVLKQFASIVVHHMSVEILDDPAFTLPKLRRLSIGNEMTLEMLRIIAKRIPQLEELAMRTGLWRTVAGETEEEKEDDILGVGAVEFVLTSNSSPFGEFKCKGVLLECRNLWFHTIGSTILVVK